MRTRTLFLSLFWVSMVCSSAVGEYIAYEGDTFPEDDGWSVVGTLPAPDQYTRSISGGVYTISAVADSHTKVIYEREISFACDNLFYEWRSRTSNNDGYGGAGILFGQPGARSLVAVSWHADYGQVRFEPIAGDGYTWKNFSLEPGEFHTFRVEGNGADYAFFVDGNPVLASALQSPGTENVFFSWNFTKQYINVPTDSDWDYVRSGEIPEPVTLLLFSGAFALMVRRRPKQ
ncbi:MAG: PEP-CTERM sorting domain-containing protein [Phycisphaerae bacterium]|nr:PEP-CTERM sorting domain-containing protein [Phycisphaerae bacterium]